MSLKGVNHISPQMTAKFLDAVEDLQKGKKGAAESNTFFSYFLPILSALMTLEDFLS